MHPLLDLSQPPDTASRLRDAIREVTRRADALQQLDAEALPTVLALIATGAFPAAARLIRRLAPAAEASVLAAAAGRYTAWSGDLDSLASLRNHTLHLLDSGSPGAGANPEPPGTADGPAGGSADGGRGAVIASGALAALERGATDRADPASAARAHAALRPLRHALAAGPLAAGPRLLADALGLEASQPTAAPAPPAGAEWLVLHLVHRGLGAEPDATRHRLRLRPALHVGWLDGEPPLPLHLNCLAFGDGTVALLVEQHPDGSLSYRLEQDSGSIPVTALLEPVLPAPPRAATVDGQRAELRPRTTPGGTILPVQLVLDAPRELRVWMDEGRPPE